MALLRPADRVQLYRALALVPLALAGTGLLSLLLFAIDLGAFGGPHHPTTARKILAAVVGNGLLVLSIASTVAAHRSQQPGIVARWCVAAYVLLVAGVSALLLLPE
jgi:hypothetical protein